MKTTPTSVTLDAQTKEMLIRRASAEDRSRSSLVRRAIIAYCESTPSPTAQQGAS